MDNCTGIIDKTAADKEPKPSYAFQTSDRDGATPDRIPFDSIPWVPAIYRYCAGVD